MRKSFLFVIIALGVMVATISGYCQYDDSKDSLKESSGEENLSQAINQPAEVSVDQLKAWQQFYQTYFGIEADFSGIKIPEKKEGFDQLIVVAKGLTLNQVFSKCQEKFNCWSWYKDLDKAISQNDRDPDDHYAVWIQERVEADEELKNISADSLEEQNILGITLLERLLYGFFYFEETGKHLDIKGITLCSGSRDRDTDVPRVDWYPDTGELEIYYCSPSDAYSNLRARATVTF